MSTAIISTPVFECCEFFKNVSGSIKAKGIANCVTSLRSDGSATQVPSNMHTPLHRSYSSLINFIEQHRKLDRSISEPTSRYKTELCRPFVESGSCKYGDKCQFAHGYSELRNLARHPKYKTELCRTFHKIGFCPYGPRCHFVHNFEEARIQNLKQSNHPINAEPRIPCLGALLRPAITVDALNINVGLLDQLSVSPQITASTIGVCAGSFNLYQATVHPQSLNLSPTLSLGSTSDLASPSSSLSESPTNSMVSFFNDESPLTVIPSATLSFSQEIRLISPRTQSVLNELRPESPITLSSNVESRLPVFNQLSNTLADLNKLKI